MQLLDFLSRDGFLGTRASLMLDIVFLALFLVVPVLWWSIYQVKSRQRYALHKRVQIVLAIVLAVAVTLFEVDMRRNGWLHRAAPPDGTDLPPTVLYALWIHLPIAVATALLWVWVVLRALARFPRPIVPGAHSREHIRLAWLAAIGMTLTALTGWVFYGLAFVR